MTPLLESIVFFSNITNPNFTQHSKNPSFQLMLFDVSNYKSWQDEYFKAYNKSRIIYLLLQFNQFFILVYPRYTLDKVPSFQGIAESTHQTRREYSIHCIMGFDRKYNPFKKIGKTNSYPTLIHNVSSTCTQIQSPYTIACLLCCLDLTSHNKTYIHTIKFKNQRNVCTNIFFYLIQPIKQGQTRSLTAVFTQIYSSTSNNSLQ